jgi:excisionase family DNA binding protein
MSVTPAVKRLIDIQTLAEALGIAVPTVYGMVSRRQIPFTKVGRLTRFDPAAIDAWITKQTFQPLQRPEQPLKRIPR